MSHRQYLALDIGHKRIGVAVADDTVRIAVPFDTLTMNEDTVRGDIASLVTSQGITDIIIGYPRNQSGSTTAQTGYIETIADKLRDLDAAIIFQDESLTSVIAKERLSAKGIPYDKAAVDAEAAAIILQDYLETKR